MSGLHFTTQSQILGMVSPGLEEPDSGSRLENMAQCGLSCSRIDEFEEKCACAGRIVNRDAGFRLFENQGEFPGS